MKYHFLSQRGALRETAPGTGGDPLVEGLQTRRVPREVIALVPESVARENVVIPLADDGETITLAAAAPDDIALADRVRFLTARNVRLVGAPCEDIMAAINRHYPALPDQLQAPSHLELYDTAIDAPAPPAPARSKTWLPSLGGSLGRGIVDFKKGLKGTEDLDTDGEAGEAPILGGKGMFFYTVEEGQRVLQVRRDGTMEVIVGPRRVWRRGSRFVAMRHHVAYPGQFLILRYRDGRQEHLTGPAEVWTDPRVHHAIETAEALQLAAREAVVVYSRDLETRAITRRIVHGPALFVPEPGEWLHTFSWHASQGGHKGVQKVPGALVFQKLWMLPDQMYHDVVDVRTADDAVLTIRLMIFFELLDIERMLETTHDPIGDFVNAATSDVVAFTGQHDFEAFKRGTGQLNELETYRQLTGRAAQCGYRINKVVYRGYGAADALQQMHDEAIQARTRLQLDRATEQQAQELEDYRLESQLSRASRRRSEQAVEVEHDLGLAQRRQEAELRQQAARQAAERDRLRQEAEVRLAVRHGQDAQAREHLAALRELGVDLTAYLTQARADRVIELRGGARPHVHLDGADGSAREPQAGG